MSSLIHLDWAVVLVVVVVNLSLGGISINFLVTLFLLDRLFSFLVDHSDLLLTFLVVKHLWTHVNQFLRVKVFQSSLDLLSEPKLELKLILQVFLSQFSENCYSMDIVLYECLHLLIVDGRVNWVLLSHDTDKVPDWHAISELRGLVMQIKPL